MMNTLQKQFVLVSHAAAITLALPFFGYSIQWLKHTSAMPASVIHPSHQLGAQIMTVSSESPTTSQS